MTLYRRLVKRENGVFTLLAEDAVPYVRGQTYQVEIVALGNGHLLRWHLKDYWIGLRFARRHTHLPGCSLFDKYNTVNYGQEV